MADDSPRTALLHRLRRAEGQLRGVQRLVEAEAPVGEVATQLAAVRKALDSAYLRLTLDFMQQSLQAHRHADARHPPDVGAVIQELQGLLGKLK